MTGFTVTHLYPALPPVRLADLDACVRSDCQLAEGVQGLDLQIDAKGSPLGGEAFAGSIPQDMSPANRAALLGIVSRHGARIEMTVTHPDGQAKPRRDALRLALRASLALIRRHPSLAVLWEPTSCLMQRAAFVALAQDDAPLSLFINIEDELFGPRRVPSLNFQGAGIWIGMELHARPGPLPRAMVRDAGLAFLATARHTPDLIRAQGFHHAGQSYRLAHAPEIGRIDLIPTARGPLDLPPSPRSEERRHGSPAT